MLNSPKNCGHALNYINCLIINTIKKVIFGEKIGLYRDTIFVNVLVVHADDIQKLYRTLQIYSYANIYIRHYSNIVMDIKHL